MQVKDQVMARGPGCLRSRGAGWLCPALTGESWDMMEGGQWREGEITVTCDTHSRLASKYSEWF